MIALLSLLCLVLSVLAGLCLWRTNVHINALAAQLARTAAVRAEAQRMREANERLAQWQSVTESSIDSGTAAVRAVHRGIAAIPFDIFEAIPATRDTSRVVRGVHDFTSDNVYAAISLVNRLAGQRGRRLLSRGERRKREPDQNSS
ncbi:hypothetical protein ATO7_14928 [Oceanococcus atlanticus]|uniref:Uncharacterized protein n=1 Tax=Oceanococcus atlanticus TaxID=1317117 RepID=A0A1Y1SAV6_9GAMM|nr:hypothetical protein [Oceanococcus atlanticus]ORE85526.1 hypothetical protein ATO7_14928 [Oceanococcus atlanticus]